jgi:hypothetical protein
VRGGAVIPRAILVHADGTTEALPPGDGIGRYIMRETKCSECGHHKVTRKYDGHFATDINTAVDGKLREGAPGPVNAGLLVYVEVCP